MAESIFYIIDTHINREFLRERLEQVDEVGDERWPYISHSENQYERENKIKNSDKYFFSGYPDEETSNFFWITQGVFSDRIPTPC